MELVNGADVVPSDVKLSEMVGVPVVFQHTPFAVIAALPSLEMTPPLVANVVEIYVTAFVASVGSVARDAGLTCAIMKSLVVNVPSKVEVPKEFERIEPVLLAVPLPPRFIQFPAPSSFAVLILSLSLTSTPSFVS